MSPALLWFRCDLRLADNPALQALIDAGHTPLPVYIHDEPDADWQTGAASRWWLHHSLIALQQSLQQHGSDLLVFQGDPEGILTRLLQQTGADRLAWNRRYEPACIKRDEHIKQVLEKQGCHVSSHNAALLREPWENLKDDGSPYRVFTPFWKKLHRIGPSREAISAIETLPGFDPETITNAIPVDSLELLPSIKWDQAFYTHWTPGEDGAWNALQHFSDQHLLDYTDHRDRPALAGTSHLSPHLHFGEISPLQIWKTLSSQTATTTTRGLIPATESYLREIAWREFSYHLLYHYPATPLQSMDTRFREFPWRKHYKRDLQRWQRGQTGIPLVDAGMRELWTTGYMHNRVRMIAASFLIKNLLIPWQEGARWFWNTLVDADLANNTMGWQWCAGCGADAAPYFRIFNPVLQGEKFDKAGLYIRRWLPELARLDSKYIHKPWTADPAVLADAGIIPGKDYPEPLVDLQDSRRQALSAWDQVRQLQRSRVNPIIASQERRPRRE
jgi:deoxyribodipyrimidine photo-lyase